MFFNLQVVYHDILTKRCQFYKDSVKKCAKQLNLGGGWFRIQPQARSFRGVAPYPFRLSNDIYNNGKHTDQPKDNMQASLSAKKITEIYDTYHHPIYRFIYRRVGDVDTARDLTADVFRKLVEAIQKTLPIENVPAWLYRTAHNTVVDFYRRQKFRRHMPIEDKMMATQNPMDAAERRMDAEIVRQTITKLTPDQQAVISLKFLQGLSNAETAKIMDKPITAVKSLQHRALAALQRHLTRTTEGIS